MFVDISPLRDNRQFRWLFAGQLISALGNMFTYVALPVQIYGITKSSALVGVLGGVQLAPLLVTALWGGALADAIDRRRLLRGAEVGLASCAALLALNAALPRPSLTLLFVVAG